MAGDEPRKRFTTFPALKINEANENKIEFLRKTEGIKGLENVLQRTVEIK